MSERTEEQKRILEKNVQQLSKKFTLGHQKSHIKYKQGIVFIGNSRIGKSTISATISGIKMRIILNDGQYKIQPQQQKHRSNKNLIRHSLTSVTQFPNIHQGSIDGKKITIVDLPGFKDTSYQKELCNWLYIKNILSQLDKVLFVMVFPVHSQQKKLHDDQIEMMHRFAQAFPTSNPNKPKENLITIVNFTQHIETQQQQNALKLQIKQNISKQLQAQNLQKFYLNSITPQKMFLMQRANLKSKSQKQLNNGVQFRLPKLTQFLKKNLSKMQKVQQSSYQINLTKKGDDQGQRLKQVIAQFSHKIIDNIGEIFEQYKKLFAKLLLKMSQSIDNVKCDKQDLKQFTKFYNDNINKYQNIQINVKQNKQNKQHLHFQSIQQVTCQIVQHFVLIPRANQEQFKKRIQNARLKSFKFIELMELFCQYLFAEQDMYLIQDINKNMKKSITIQCKNALYLYESVSDYIINPKDQAQQHYEQNSNVYIYEMYAKNFVRISTFIKELKRYFQQLLNRKQKLSAKKNNIQILSKLKDGCQLMNFTALKNQYFILEYKTLHKKLQDPYVLKISIRLIQLVQKILLIQQNVKQDNDIKAWKTNNIQWQSIINKGYIQILNYLTKTNYNKVKLLQLYLKLDFQFQQLIILLRSIVQQVKQQIIDKSQAYALCMKVSDHFIQYKHYHHAQICCQLAQDIYRFQDTQMTANAKLKYISILKLYSAPINMSQEQQHITKNPWINIEEKQYIQILKQAKKQYQNNPNIGGKQSSTGSNHLKSQKTVKNEYNSFKIGGITSVREGGIISPRIGAKTSSQLLEQNTSSPLSKKQESKLISSQTQKKPLLRSMK